MAVLPDTQDRVSGVLTGLAAGDRAMLIALAVGYTRLTATVGRIAAELRGHKQQQAVEASEFVRKDVQDTRNRFIDERLNEMNRKLDILIERRSR